MKKFVKIITVSLTLCFITLSCDDDDSTAVNNNFESPNPASLIFPENNTVCNEGTIISETETEVLFRWQESENTSSYILNINNLDDGSSRNINTNSTEFLIRILRGTPYSWSVRSIGLDGDESTESPVWSFYNAGLPVQSHAPFPATVVSPSSGSTIEQDLVTLEWEASDIDNDISTYTIFFDTVNPPVTNMNTTGNTNMEVSVTSGSVYYWRIVTTDEVGNSSTSQVFQFAVN